MASSRIVYQNWIAELGRDPDTRPELEMSKTDPEEGQRLEQLQEQVKKALAELDESEREFVERFYFMGQGYFEIAHLSGRKTHKLEALHKRAVRKLKRKLYPLVAELYGLPPEVESECPLCNSEFQPAIDKIIENRDRRSTWRPVIAALKKQFDLTIVTPQTLIGHEKYH